MVRRHFQDSRLPVTGEFVLVFQGSEAQNTLQHLLGHSHSTTFHPSRQMHILGIVTPSGKQLVLFRKKDLLGRALLVLGGLRIRTITTLTGRYSTEPTQWDRFLPPSAISAFRDVFDSVGRTWINDTSAVTGVKCGRPLFHRNEMIITFTATCPCVTSGPVMFLMRNCCANSVRH